MDMLTGIGCIVAVVFGIMLSVYLTLCFTSWISDVIENKSWRYWK